MKKKGFTLIELIAVIVVLAIITLIAVPIMSKVVDKARKGAAEASALNYIDAVEKYMMLHDMNPDKYPYDIKGGTFNVAESTEISLLDIIIPKAKAEETIPSLNSIINVKGKKPTSGTVTTNEKGKVTEADLTVGNYSIECTGDSCEATSSGGGSSIPQVTLSIDTPSSTEFRATTTLTLSATTNSSDEITWSSSDSTIATVSNEGVVTGVKPGSVTITATVGELTDTIDLIVKGGPTKVDAASGETHKGIVYLDPTNLSAECNASNSVSTTEVKTGCMKWYIFNDSGDNYTMILDHNTTARIKWNDSGSNVAYESSNLKAVVDDLVTTSKWVVTPRLITASEVNTIVGGVSTWDVNNYNTWFYFEGTGTKNQTIPTYDSSNRSSYDWLYNNLCKCKTDSYDFGCTIEDNNRYSGYGTAGAGLTLAYWTSTPVGTAGSDSYIWLVRRDASLLDNYASNAPLGIRPVIEVNKSLFE